MALRTGSIRTVESRQNTRVKELRAALLRPAKGAGGVIGLEGLHLVQEAARSGLRMSAVFVAQGHEVLLDGLALAPEVELLALPAEVLGSVVTTEAPQPIAALAASPEWGWERMVAKDALVVVLAGIQDPGNLGTIVRSAEAFGATGVVTLRGTVSAWNPKSMRASAGSVFRLPLIEATEEDCFRRLREARIQTIAAMPHEAVSLDEVELHWATALVIGSEGAGIPSKVAERCTRRVRIPTPGPVESLNAAIAASVLLYEAARQRASSSQRAHSQREVLR